MNYNKVAVITSLHDKVLFGRTRDGERIIFSRLSLPMRDARVGDRFTFEPGKAFSPNADFFAFNPQLIVRGEQFEPTFSEETAPEESEDFGAGLPCRHDRHYTSDGFLKAFPRPCDLQAQRIALAGAQTHANQE